MPTLINDHSKVDMRSFGKGSMDGIGIIIWGSGSSIIVQLKHYPSIEKGPGYAPGPLL